MKTIIYNYDEIKEEVINNVVKRAKLLIVNSKNEIAIVFSHFNYFLVGGHVENDESDYECLDREIEEEFGAILPVSDAKKFYEIKYLNKDYPKEGKNTLSLINYYFLMTDIKPNAENLNLTQDEKYGDFHIVYINIFDAVDKLTESLSSATRPGLVEDTIDVIKEYIKLNLSNDVKTHEMYLNDSPFQLIKKGAKTIELRLRDEKRRKIKENDEIIFTNLKDNKKLKVTVKKLHMYNSFEELYTHFDKVSLGYDVSDTANHKDMEKYYSKEQQKKYGVVGIEIVIRD